MNAEYDQLISREANFQLLNMKLVLIENVSNIYFLQVVIKALRRLSVENIQGRQEKGINLEIIQQIMMIMVIIQSLWLKVLYIFILSEREINRKSLFRNAFDMVDVGKRIQSLRKLIMYICDLLPIFVQHSPRARSSNGKTRSSVLSGWKLSDEAKPFY